MEDNKLPMKPLPVTKEAVKAKASSELTRLNYQNFLKELVATKPEPNNLKEVQEIGKKGKKLYKELDALRVIEKRPHDDNAQAVQDGFMDFMNPLANELARLARDLATVNATVLAEQRKIDEQNKKALSVRADIQGFVNKMTLAISDARTDSEIVRIQKLIGTEKSRDKHYGELLTELKTACDNLNPKINERKEDIRKMAALQQKSEEAIQSGDIQSATEIKEATEILEHKMEEDVLRLQDAAYDATSGIDVVLTESTAQAVKGRRLWRWRVDDIEKLYKKRPELVKKEPNGDAIEIVLSEYRKNGQLDNMDEINLDGLVFYIKAFY